MCLIPAGLNRCVCMKSTSPGWSRARVFTLWACQVSDCRVQVDSVLLNLPVPPAQKPETVLEWSSSTRPSDFSGIWGGGTCLSERWSKWSSSYTWSHTSQTTYYLSTELPLLMHAWQLLQCVNFSLVNVETVTPLVAADNMLTVVALSLTFRWEQSTCRTGRTPSLSSTQSLFQWPR